VYSPIAELSQKFPPPGLLNPPERLCEHVMEAIWSFVTQAEIRLKSSLAGKSDIAEVQGAVGPDFQMRSPR